MPAFRGKTGTKAKTFLGKIAGLMDTTQIIDEISRLTLPEKLYIMETVLRSIRQETEPEQTSLAHAASLLLADYQEDKELTAFTALDGEDFHEAK